MLPARMLSEPVGVHMLLQGGGRREEILHPASRVCSILIAAKHLR